MNVTELPLFTNLVSLFYVQSMLRICGFYTCKSAYLAKFICNPQRSSMDLGRWRRFESCDTHTVPAEVKQSIALPSCFGSYTRNKCPLGGLFSDIFQIFVLFGGDVTVRMVAKCMLTCCLGFLSAVRPGGLSRRKYV